jgi:hypothetical protein
MPVWVDFEGNSYNIPGTTKLLEFLAEQEREEDEDEDAIVPLRFIRPKEGV